MRSFSGSFIFPFYWNAALTLLGNLLGNLLGTLLGTLLTSLRLCCVVLQARDMVSASSFNLLFILGISLSYEIVQHLLWFLDGYRKSSPPFSIPQPFFFFLLSFSTSFLPIQFHSFFPISFPPSLISLVVPFSFFQKFHQRHQQHCDQRHPQLARLDFHKGSWTKRIVMHYHNHILHIRFLCLATEELRPAALTEMHSSVAVLLPKFWIW